MTRASLVAAVLLALGLALVPFGAVADTSSDTLKKAAAENARYQKVLNSLAQADEDATFFYQSAVERCAPNVSGNDCRKQAAADLQAKHDDIGKRRNAAIKDHEARMQAIIAGDQPGAASAGGAGGSWTDPEGNVVSGVPVYWTAPNGQKFKWAPTYRFGMLTDPDGNQVILHKRADGTFGSPS